MKPLLPRILHWFAPPRFPGDEERTRRAALIDRSISVGMIYILIIILSALNDPEHHT